MVLTSANHAVHLAAVTTVLTWVLLQGIQAGVVGDFNHVERCKDYLYMGTPPRGYFSNSFKKVCQRYEDKPRYITLYDPHKRIPIYSAYTFKKSDGEKKVDFPWMFEPQVRLSLFEDKLLMQQYFSLSLVWLLSVKLSEWSVLSVLVDSLNHVCHTAPHQIVLIKNFIIFGKTVNKNQ